MPNELLEKIKIPMKATIISIVKKKDACQNIVSIDIIFTIKA
jgi:hypothetical protein